MKSADKADDELCFLTQEDLYMDTKTEVLGSGIHAGSGKWRLEGYDTFEGGEGAYYSLDGEYNSEDEAKEAARARLAHLEETQPSDTSDGQDDDGIQDEVYIVSPDGMRRRFLG